jgi:hypothetical protein
MANNIASSTPSGTAYFMQLGSKRRVSASRGKTVCIAPKRLLVQRRLSRSGAENCHSL